MEVECTGTGSPTILLEAGGDSDIHGWPDAFIRSLATETTTCRYSRPGLGNSSTIAGPVTMHELADRLFAMQDALEAKDAVNPPYLYVGWSLGGSIILGEVLARPERAVGMVVIDTDFPVDFFKACAAAGRTKADSQADYDGDKVAKDIETEIAHEVHPLPGITIRILSAAHMGTDCVSGCDAEAAALAAAQLREWSVLGPQVTQTIVQGDHDSIVTFPQYRALTLQQILNVLAEARLVPAAS